MLFNSIDFAIFLPIVFVLYWYVLKKSWKAQNILIVAASYLFYGWWDWRFLGLIILSTVADYTIGQRLDVEQQGAKRKLLLWTSIVLNLGLLGFFKYYNFFLDNFIDAFQFFGNTLEVNRLKIILPVGISFYTFQTLSYTIDVYRKKMKSTDNIVVFAAFVSFFPQLVAGPIERATHLLPQFEKKRTFDYTMAVNGMRQILWGLVKKVVIADSCAEYANIIFNNHEIYGGSTLFFGALFFTFQIYGDFSGYSDIAIGTAKLFGFDLMQNFAFPYFSRDIAEFWRRWHISLSTWFRDYLYIPLGGSRGGMWMKIRNTFAIFLVSGFWHGANWTFIVWGALNALYFLPLLLLGKNRNNIGVVAEGKLIPSLKELWMMGSTFFLTVIAWVFFRAESIEHAMSYLYGLFSKSLFSIPEVRPSLLIVLISLFLVVEWLGRENKFALESLPARGGKPLRWSIYVFLIFVVFVFQGKQQTFIYFQF